jgi:hypothetical protein
VIPWPLPFIDQLNTGKLTGEVPPNWTREGWAASLRDRLRRVKETDGEKTVTRALLTELAAVEGG